jgi:hypothetical protein
VQFRRSPADQLSTYFEIHKHILHFVYYFCIYIVRVSINCFRIFVCSQRRIMARLKTVNLPMTPDLQEDAVQPGIVYTTRQSYSRLGQ